MSTISTGVSAVSAAAPSAAPALPALDKLVADAVKFYAANGHFRDGDIDKIVSKLTQDGLVSDDDLKRLDAKLQAACVFGAADEATARRLFSRVAGELEFRVGRGDLAAEGGVGTISGMLIDNSAFADTFDAAALSKAAAFAADRFSAAGVRDATRTAAADGVYSESELEAIWNAASTDRDVSLWDVRAMYNQLNALLKEGKLTEAQHKTMCAQLDTSLQARLAVGADRAVLSNQAREFVSGYLPVREGLEQMSLPAASALVSRLVYMGTPEGAAHGNLHAGDIGALAAASRDPRGYVDLQRAVTIGAALHFAKEGGQISESVYDATVAELRRRGIDVTGQDFRAPQIAAARAEMRDAVSTELANLRALLATASAQGATHQEDPIGITYVGANFDVGPLVDSSTGTATVVHGTMQSITTRGELLDQIAKLEDRLEFLGGPGLVGGSSSTNPAPTPPPVTTGPSTGIPAPADLSTTTALADAAARAAKDGGVSAIAAYVQRAIQLAAADNTDGKLTQAELIGIRAAFGQSLANVANRISSSRERAAFFAGTTDAVDVAIQGQAALLNADAAAYAARL